MRAVVLDEKGGPEVLRVRDIPAPRPGRGEIVVDVAATAVNRADILQRLGLYPGPPADFEVPGLEYAGRVWEIGEGVTEWATGDEVMGITGGGGYAERVVVHERQAVAVPPNIPVEDAAAIPEVFVTAFDALVQRGRLTSGRTALVHAGASGVGTAAIQIAKAMGATILVTASTGKVDACRHLGADLAIDYTHDDFVDVVLEYTGGRGVDVVLDVIGGEYLDRNLDSVRIGGTIVQVGVMGGGSATFALGKMLPRRATLVGTVLRARPLEEKIAVTQQFAEELLPLFADGTLQPVIDSRHPLDDIAEAHRHMEANANVGKIVIDISRTSPPAGDPDGPTIRVV